MNSPLVSVIVPVYNVAPYLEQCLDSIVNQSYRNLVIILVNYAKALLSPYLTKARRLSNMYSDWKTNLSWRVFYTRSWFYAFLVMHVQPLVKKVN